MSMSQMRPEVALLLACARTHLSSGETDRIRELARQPLDWDFFVAIVRRSRIQPLVYRSLAAVTPESIPASTLTSLKEAFQSNIVHIMGLVSELNTLCKHLEAHGIPAIPYKGPTLAIAAYGNLTLREFDDLDMLVQEHDLPRVKAALQSLQYRPRTYWSAVQEALLWKHCNEDTFWPGHCRFPVEIHWEVTPPYFGAAMNTQELWARCKTLSLAGVETRCFAPEDLLLILCLHGTKHLWDRLEWVCAIGELIRANPDLDWICVRSEAQRICGWRMVRIGVALTHDLLGHEIPEALRGEIAVDPVVPRLVAEVRQRLFRPVYAPPTLRENLRFDIRSRERTLVQVRYVLARGLALTEPDLIVRGTPPSLHLFYPIRRVCRLAGKFLLRK